MLHEYSNLYFPICSLVISLLIFILYFSKKNIKNNETKLYSLLLKFTLLEATFTFLLTLSVHLFFNENTTFYFALANKVLYSIYIAWISVLFLYFSSLSYEDKGQMKIFKTITITLNVILILLIFLMPIELIYLRDEKISNSYGASSVILYLGCALYIFLMIIVTLINFKSNKDKKKYIPLGILIILMVAIMIIRAVDPYFNATSNVISLVALVMYFTIENPDLKMLNQLQLAQEQAEKSNKIKSEFLSSMSHEIRTPLNAIVGFSQLIESSDTLEEAKENAKDIVDASNILLNMFSNIIDIYQLESKQLVVKSEPYDFNEEINSFLDLFEEQAKSKKLILIRDIDLTIPKLIGDINIIKKALVNIIDNAIKYSENGTIKFKTTYKINHKKCQLIIIISDTGKGIRKEFLESIFNPFERGNNKNSSSNGMGLGLSISKRLVDLLNGKIKIVSEENKGTEVIIEISQNLFDSD